MTPGTELRIYFNSVITVIIYCENTDDIIISIDICCYVDDIINTINLKVQLVFLLEQFTIKIFHCIRVPLLWLQVYERFVCDESGFVSEDVQLQKYKLGIQSNSNERLNQYSLHFVGSKNKEFPGTIYSFYKNIKIDWWRNINFYEKNIMWIVSVLALFLKRKRRFSLNDWLNMKILFNTEQINDIDVDTFWGIQIRIYESTDNCKFFIIA